MNDLTSAIKADKESGMSVEDIMSKYNISQATVYRRLSTEESVDISTVRSKTVDVIYALAKRGKGITHQEEWDILVSMLGNDAQEAKKGIRRSVREKAAKNDENVIFVPNWLDASNILTPIGSQHLMCELAHELNTRIEESVDIYMQETGNNHYSDIKHALLTYAVQNYSNMPISTYCSMIEDIVDSLEENLNKEKENVPKDTILSNED